MRRYRKILLWFLVVVTVLIIGIFFTASVYIKSFKPDFEKALTENLGMETIIEGPISLKMMPGISFVANDIKVVSNETYLIRLKGIEVSINYMGIFGIGTRVNGLRFIKPQVYIVREEDGSFNFSPKENNINIENPDAIKTYEINLKTLVIEDGILLYFDRQSGDTLKLSGLNIRSEYIGLKGTARKIDANSFNFDGDLALTHFKLNMLKVDSLNFKVAGRGGKISIQPVDADYFGGKSSGKAIIDFTPASPFIHIQHQMIGLDIEQFQETNHSGSILEGKLNFNLDITFESFDWSKVSKTLTGNMIVDGENLKFNGLHLEKILKKYNDTDKFDVNNLGALFFAGPYRAVFTKTLDFSDIKSNNGITHVNHLVSRWNVSNGIASAQDVAFNTDKYRFSMNGQIDFTTRSFRNLSISLLNSKGCAAITQRLNGLFNSPESVTVSEIKNIPDPVGNYWKQLASPSGDFCTVVYKGSVAHPAL